MAIDRKEQIYSTARSLFRERGYPATTVRDIAREMNMQAGSLYAHIDSKEDVLWEIVNRAADQFLAAAEPIALPTCAPPRSSASLCALTSAWWLTTLPRPPSSSTSGSSWAKQRRHAIAERRNRYESLYRHVVEEGIASGDFAPTDPKMATLLVLSAVNWLPQWYNPSGPLSPAEVADSFMRFCAGGLEPR